MSDFLNVSRKNPGKGKFQCLNCQYTSTRKYNLQRHYLLVHGQGVKVPEYEQYQKPLMKPNNFQNTREYQKPENPPWELSWENIERMAKVNNTISNSKQTFDQINFLQEKANYLEKELAALYYNYWMIPQSHVQGISGYICKLCNKFSFKLVMDLGYDMTMLSKHRCGQQIGCYEMPLPENLMDVNEWAATVILSYLSYYSSIGKMLRADDMPQHSRMLEDPYIRENMMDRYPIFTVPKDYKPDWISRATSNPGKQTLVTDKEIIDFLRIAKSTYAILELKEEDGETRHYFMRMER